MRDEVFERICVLTAKNWHLDGSLIHPESTFDDIFDPDSLDSVELVADVEQEFNVRISDSEMYGISTFGELADLVRTRKR